tara:strand:+ start:1679 stop:2221 length:543 start_codon:yes stop_codon:yes gene_type:complete
MAFSVSNFRSKGLVGGGARPNLFDVQITGAPGSIAGQVTATEFTFLCKIASIPPSTMGVVEVPYFGRMVKVPGNRTFDNISVTVINDEDFKLRNGFENWMDQMNAHVNNDSMPPNDILGSMRIQHYSRMNTEIGGGAWKFTNMFPVNLSEIALDWGSNDTIEEFTVDFAYDYWEHDASTT